MGLIFKCTIHRFVKVTRKGAPGSFSCGHPQTWTLQRFFQLMPRSPELATLDVIKVYWQILSVGKASSLHIQLTLISFPV